MIALRKLARKSGSTIRNWPENLVGLLKMARKYDGIKKLDWESDSAIRNLVRISGNGF